LTACSGLRQSCSVETRSSCKCWWVVGPSSQAPAAGHESQNHRMFGVGRDLCGSSSPTPCQSRVTQSRLHKTASRWVLNISREGDSTTSLGSLCQGSVILRVKKFFLMFSWSFLCFSLCPLPLVSGAQRQDKSPAPSS